MKDKKAMDKKKEDKDTMDKKMEDIETMDKKMEDIETKDKKMEDKKRNDKKIKGVVIVLLLLVLVTAVGVGYLQKVIYYRTHYFNGTQINGRDFSGADAGAAAAWLVEQTGEYCIEIVGRDRQGSSVSLGVIQAEQISLMPENPQAAAEDILNQQEELLWFETLGGIQHSYNIVQGVVFDVEALEKELKSLEAFQQGNMTASTDAHIGAFSEEQGCYVLIPETYGNMVSMEKVLGAVADAISMHETVVDLEEQDCYIQPEVTCEDRELLAHLEEVNSWLEAEITYDWNGFETVVDMDVIKGWIVLEDDKPSLDEEAVGKFVTEKASQYDTYGKIRTFRTTAGAELSLGSGAFGWKTDREGETAALIEAIKAGDTVTREPLYSHTAPQKGLDDIGSSYVEADLTHQHLYLYYQGELVMETDFVSGDMRYADRVSPQGVFGLTYKTTNAVLRGANYETPVNYWMPFHGNFGMHDATWRGEFGGEIYLTNGSHGCLNLPLDKAAELYQYLYTGYPVICYY